MKLIPNKLTVMKALDVLKAFRAAFLAEIGSLPSNATLAILVAQSALECARWVSMHCFNFGNMRPPKGWAGSYCQFRCNEKIKGVWVWYDPPDPGSNFLAFESAEEGARYYMRKLRQTWPEAWAAALKGDAGGFVHGLKLRGYFTADETVYRASVQRLCTEFQVYVNREFTTEPTDVTVDEHQVDMTAINDVVSAPIVIAPALFVGCKGVAVEAWQKVVGAKVDGDFGPATEAATKTWQAKHGMPANGIVCMPELVAAGLAPSAPEGSA